MPQFNNSRHHTKADSNKVIKFQTIANNYDTTSDSVVNAEGDIM